MTIELKIHEYFENVQVLSWNSNQRSKPGIETRVE